MRCAVINAILKEGFENGQKIISKKAGEDIADAFNKGVSSKHVDNHGELEHKTFESVEYMQ